MTVAAEAEPHRSRVRRRWTIFVAATANGLPRGRVLAAGIGALAVVFAVLVATGVNGTSSGAFFALLHTGQDPALLLGSPNLIRTDEWNVQTVWAIAQFQQGLPAVNGTFPGGMDATIPQDLPRVDWSVAFRPHLWGFMFMDVGHAQAWKWWTPVFALAASAYALALTFLPRRPVVAMGIAIGFTASPYFAWWLLQTTLWPVTWGFAVLAAAAWAVRTTTRRSLWAWAGVVAYLTVVMGMGIYVPFIIVVAIVVAAVAVGIVVEAAPARGWPTVLGRVSSVLVAGVVGGAVLAVWLATRWTTVSGFLSTAYPGERLRATGTNADARSVAALFGSSFTDSLRNAGTFLDTNASESATFFLPGVFLGLVVLWVAVREYRARGRLPWSLILGYGALLVLLAFIFVPGWDGIAHLLLLDRTTALRTRIGLGFGSIVVVILLLARITHASRPGWLVSLAGPVVYLASQCAIAIAVSRSEPQLLAASGLWWVWAGIGALAILAVARGWRITTAVSLLAISVAASAGVNPVYVGVLDLRDTAPAEAIEELDTGDPGAWIALGGNLPTALLLETGATAYNGFQGAPGEEMWDAIDPDGTYKYEWNRLGAVSWVVGEGDPVVSNPAPDQIRVTFDACSEFAQQNVRYVVSDESQTPSSECLVEQERFDLPGTALTLWRIVHAGSTSDG